MRIAAVCATPFQALNLVKLRLARWNQDQMEVFFENDSAQMDAILKNLQKEGLFDRLYVFHYVPKDKKVEYLPNDFLQAAWPAAFINHQVAGGFRVKEHAYDMLTVTSGHDLEMALVRCYPGTRIIAYDDGLGSYEGDLIHDHHLNWIWRALGRRNELIQPECLYVNNPAYCRSTLTTRIERIVGEKQANSGDEAIIRRIFAPSGTRGHEGRRLVFLAQPVLEFFSDGARINQQIIDQLNVFSADGIYRQHPRDTSEVRTELPLDPSQTIWELACEQSVTQDSILVSICSTAQIMPKILYNLEPYLVFTYKLYMEDHTPELENQLCLIVERMKEIYSRRDKIIEPETIQELTEILSGLLNRKKAGEAWA